jgi:hypothetical protein
MENSTRGFLESAPEGGSSFVGSFVGTPPLPSPTPSAPGADGAFGFLSVVFFATAVVLMVMDWMSVPITAKCACGPGGISAQPDGSMSAAVAVRDGGG